MSWKITATRVGYLEIDCQPSGYYDYLSNEEIGEAISETFERWFESGKPEIFEWSPSDLYN